MKNIIKTLIPLATGIAVGVVMGRKSEKSKDKRAMLLGGVILAGIAALLATPFITYFLFSWGWIN